jgi:hypothetical protein
MLSPNAAASVAARAVACVASAMGVACIPDLPSTTQPDASLGSCGDGIIELAAGEQCDPGPGAGDASVGGCSSTCQMQCQSGTLPWSVNHHCYALAQVEGAGSLREASNACPGASHVVTFASEEEFQHVLSLVADAGAFWVGISTTSAPYAEAPYEPSWAPNCPGCYAHLAVPHADLPSYPDADVDGASLDCVAALSDSTQPWQKYPCRGLSRELLGVVCELEPVGRQSRPCSAGICIDLVKTHGQKTYVYQETRATPDAASHACAALGGRLVVLQSSDEREQLWRELYQLTVPPTAFWVGLTQVTPGSIRNPLGTWAWDDRTPAAGSGAYTAEWAESEPLRFGQGGMTRAYLYHDDHTPEIDDTLAHDEPTLTVSGTLPYVCEIPPGVAQ